MDRYIMMQTDFRASQFPDDEDIGLLAIQPPDTIASPRIFCWI
jgi:hypothetical protein